ncbi:unnamed protein product [Sphagnum jensenii]|uniref:Cinnamyl alcohol dehydrogenase n=1 Tax=Sphagnum jensenii TaxID=128206 RepID=A0ABP1BSA9_9BRYO
MPTNLPLDAAAPLLCAGITVYSPMKHYEMDVAGKHFGVVSLGGLGHMAIKFGKAFGSGTGGIKETQEMLDLCGEHNITRMIEKIPISYINTVIERLEKVDVKYHFVIDIGNGLKSEN